MNSEYLFVYGTLQQELDNEMSKFLIQHSETTGNGFVFGKLYRISWFPGMVLSNDKTDKVFGSIFKLNDYQKVFGVLDGYEGFDKHNPKSSLFIRTKTIAYLENNKAIKTWVYLYNRTIDNEEQIYSGRFIK